MRARLHAWWQYLGKHNVAAIITVFVLVVVIVFIFASYLFADWFGWTGFNGDTIKADDEVRNIARVRTLVVLPTAV